MHTASVRCFLSVLVVMAGLSALTPTAKAQPAKEWSTDPIPLIDDSGEIRIKLQPGTVKPGETVKLSVEFTPGDSWYLYEHSVDGEYKPKFGQPTLLHLDIPKTIKVSGPTSSIATVVKTDDEGNPANAYTKPVTFTYELTVPADQVEGELEIRGMVGVQLCTSGKCTPKLGFDYRAKLTVAKEQNPEATKVEWIKGNYTKIKKQIQDSLSGSVLPATTEKSATVVAPPVTSNENSERPIYSPRILGSDVNSLAMALFLAFLGGSILNLMPCVLPVIGLKVLSFVEQAGKDRRQIFLLNLVYSLGIISVFIALAAFTIIFQKGWGQQMQSAGFNITMMAIVFAMALSFLSVWEIPIPGFATTPGISRSSHRAGYEGAFLKGIVTTLLATPCSGPLLGTVFAFTAKLPSYQVALVFFTVGLGMAAPYLIIGTFPRMIKMLPKPGEWMDTFKNLMGFILLGTVVYLFTLIPHQLFLPTLTMLFAIWFALWLVGRVPIYESHFNRLKPWLIGGPIAALIAVGGFWIFSADKGQHELNWIAYSPAALQKATAEGKTVLLDMTADWCPTCKVNLSVAINREAVKELVKKYDVVAMKADLTEETDDTNALLEQLQSKSIPILAVYPAEEPYRPYVLRDSVWQQDVLDVLKLAGPSKTSPVTMVPTSVKK